MVQKIFLSATASFFPKLCLICSAVGILSLEYMNILHLVGKDTLLRHVMVRQNKMPPTNAMMQWRCYNPSVKFYTIFG